MSLTQRLITGFGPKTGSASVSAMSEEDTQTKPLLSAVVPIDSDLRTGHRRADRLLLLLEKSSSRDETNSH